MTILLKLFWVFFRIGAFTFGGGYAMISLIEDQVVTRNKWLSKEEFLDILAIMQSFPGAIAINMANFIGGRLAGTIGSLFAVLGASLPSVLIIVLIATFYDQFSAQEWWFKFVSGLLPVILALIIKAALGLFKKAVPGRLEFVIFSVALIGMVAGIHPLFILTVGGIFGYFRQRELHNKMRQKLISENEGCEK